MTGYPLTCSGPGPHDPADGVLGTTSVEGATGICGAVVCLPAAPSPAPAPPTDAEIEAARLSLATATTVTQTKTRALALDDLRAAQIAAIVS